MFSWPLGKYNGKRIEGFSIKFSLHVFDWWWVPEVHFKFGYNYVIWLCLTVRFKTEYQYKTQGS